MSEEENDLSLIDLIMPNVYIRSLLIYNYHIDDFEELLNEYLNLYFPQVFKCFDENNKKLIQCEKVKVYSSESRLNESISKYLNDKNCCEELFRSSLFPNNSSPLFYLDKKDLKDGTILCFIGHHYFSDGHGFSLLGKGFSLWLKDKKANQFFDHNRSKLNQIGQSSLIKFNHIEMSLHHPRDSSFYYFSSKTIRKCFTKKYLFEKLNIVNEKVSLNDVIVGWLTKLISEIRQHPSDTIIKIGMALNGRNILTNVNENYFGNCSFYICFSFSMFDLNNLTINELSQRINQEKVQYMCREYLESSLSFLNKYSRTSKINLGWNPSNGIDLSFTNWSKFPIYECDFGHGPPISFNIPPILSDGLIFIFPTLNSDEIELHITLKDSQAESIQNHFLFQ